MFDDYLKHGWKLCRIAPGSKGPRYQKWNEPGHEVTVFPIGNGAGLLHAFSGTMALDVDNYDVAKSWLLERSVDLDALLMADDAVQIVSGRPGSAKLLYACEPRAGKACAPYPTKDKDGKPIEKMALDFRCATASGTSQQDVLPPTIHPGMGRPYEWRLGVCADWRALPPLPSELAAVWSSIAEPVTAEPVTAVATPAPTSDDQIQRWLRTQDPSMCRNDWVNVGAKLHAHYQGSREGFLVWQHWSSTSPKWNEEARAQEYAVWKSFKLEGRPLATLDREVRELPAAPEEFPEVVPAGTTPVNPQETVPALVESIAPELSSDRELRDILSGHVVVQTGPGLPYFVRPGHPIASIRVAAGYAGVEMDKDKLNTTFGPYLPPIPVGKNGAVVFPDASEVVKRGKWRKEVHRVGFKPGAPEFYVRGDGHQYMNGFKAVPLEPIKPTARQIEPLLWLLRRVSMDKGEPVFAMWLLRLFAFVLRNPGTKVKWAPLLFSTTQGTGKTSLMQTLPELLFGRQYVSTMVHSVLRERFAAARFDATWWVVLSEMHSDEGKKDARAIANKLKPWITDAVIPIEKKGKDAYDIDNVLQFTAMSNHADALFVEDGEGERRWLVGRMEEKALTNDEKLFLNPVFGDDYARDPKAANWLQWFFLNDVDLTSFNPNESPPETLAKEKIREQSRSTWEDEVFEAHYVGAPPFDKDLVLLPDITKRLLLGKNVSNAQAEKLLEKIGARKIDRRFNFARAVYSLRHHEQWAACTPSQVEAHLRGAARPFDPVDDLIGAI